MKSTSETARSSRKTVVCSLFSTPIHWINLNKSNPTAQFQHFALKSCNTKNKLDRLKHNYHNNDLNSRLRSNARNKISLRETLKSRIFSDRSVNMMRVADKKSNVQFKILKLACVNHNSKHPILHSRLRSSVKITRISSRNRVDSRIQLLIEIPSFNSCEDNLLNSAMKTINAQVSRRLCKKRTSLLTLCADRLQSKVIGIIEFPSLSWHLEKRTQHSNEHSLTRNKFVLHFQRLMIVLWDNLEKRTQKSLVCLRRIVVSLNSKHRLMIGEVNSKILAMIS